MTARRGVALAILVVALVVGWRWHGRSASEAPAASAGSAARVGRMATPAHAVEATGRKIAGTVLLEDKPVAATLRLMGVASQERVTADSEGNFAFEHLAAAEYTLVAEYPGATGAMRTIDLRDPRDVGHLTLVLHACDAVVEGTVRDTSGPIAHAYVAESPDGRAAGAGVESGDDGHYRLCVSPNDEGLIARADGYADTEVQLLVSGHMRRDIELVPEAVIQGRVIRSSDRTPVAGAVVVVSPDGADWRQAPRRSVTDNDGQFRIVGVPPGRRIVTATADHLVSSAPVPVITEVGATGDAVTVEMRNAASVRGIVRDGGAPVAGAWVTLTPLDQSPVTGRLQGITRADGSFEVADLLPGHYRASVHNYKLFHEVDVAVAHDDVAGLAIDVESLATISGRVTFRGAPVEGASISGQYEPVVTDARGEFTVHVIQPGTVQLYAESKRLGAFTHGPEISVAAHEHKTGVEIELDHAASVAGTVIDQDGAPVAGVLVRFSLLHGADFGIASTAEDGTFVARAMLGGGSYVYEVRANDGSSTVFQLLERKHAAPIAVRDASTHITGVRIRVRVDRLTISGRVISASGDPLPDVSVQATDASVPYEWLTSATSSTDASGAFTLRNLQAATYKVTARSARGVHEESVVAGKSGVTIVIPEAATIDGVLDGFHDTPEITLVSREREGLYRPLVTGTHFVFRDVPPGPYAIRAVASDGDARAQVTVAPGGHSAVTLRRVGRGSVAGTVVNAAGAPIAGAQCRSDVVSMNAQVTDGAGAFRIDNIPAGKAIVLCTANQEYEEITATVPSDGLATVRLVIKPPVPEPERSAGMTCEYPLGEPIITAIAPGGPADKAGLHVDDVLVEVDGQPIAGFGIGPESCLDNLPPDKPATITFDRGDKRMTTQLSVP